MPVDRVAASCHADVVGGQHDPEDINRVPLCAGGPVSSVHNPLSILLLEICFCLFDDCQIILMNGLSLSLFLSYFIF